MALEAAVLRLVRLHHHVVDINVVGKYVGTELAMPLSSSNSPGLVDMGEK